MSSYIGYAIIYDVSSSTLYNPRAYLEIKTSQYDTIEESFMEIRKYMSIHNHFMKYSMENLSFHLVEKEESSSTILKEAEYVIVAESFDKQLKIIVKKIYSE